MPPSVAVSIAEIPPPVAAPANDSRVAFPTTPWKSVISKPNY